MNTLDVLKRSIRYNKWANETLFESIQQLDPVPEKILTIFGHAVAAEQLWLDRLQGDEQTMPVWPALSVEAIHDRMSLVGQAWQLFIDNQRDEKLLRPVAYTNSKGVPWANRVEEVVHHVTIHAAYHRGQVALLMRQHGADPPLTDFIHAVRAGILDSTGEE